MVIAMLIGTGVGMLLHLTLGLVLSPILGMFETMNAGLVDRDVRRNVAMRDSMAAGSAALGASALVGAVFGAVVVLGLKIYDRAVRGAVLDAAS